MPRSHEDDLIAQALTGDEKAIEALLDYEESLSPEQVEADLRAAGFDVEAEKARAEAFLKKLEHPELEAPTSARFVGEDSPRRRRSRAAAPAWFAAAAIAASTAATLYASRPMPLPGGGTGPGPTDTASTAPVPTEPPPPEDHHAEAEALRMRAGEAYRKGHPSDALTLIDEAREMDPDGDVTTYMVQFRRQVMDALEEKPRAPR